MTIIDYIIIFIVSGLGAYVASYSREKGKNLATKEDIAKITEEVEKVKSLSLIKNKRSEALISLEVKAFTEIADHIFYLQTYCHRESQYSEHAVPGFEIPNTSLFQKAMNIKELTIKYTYILSDNLRSSLFSLAQSTFMCGKMEMYKDSLPQDKGFYGSIVDDCEKVMKEMRKELFS